MNIIKGLQWMGRNELSETTMQLIDQAVEDIILCVEGWRWDRHSPLQKAEREREQRKKEMIQLSRLAGEPYVIPIDDENQKTETRGRQILSTGRTEGLGYFLSYFRDPTLSPGFLPDANASLAVLEYALKHSEKLMLKASILGKRLKDHSQEKENIPSFLILKFHQYPIKDNGKLATRPLKTMSVVIGLGGIANRKRKGRKLKNGKYSNKVAIKVMRLAEKDRREKKRASLWGTLKQIWLAPETPPKDIRFLLALYLYQEGMIQLTDPGIYKIFSEYLRRPFRITETLPEFLFYLRDHYALPQDLRGLREYIGKAKHKFRWKEAQEYIVDDTEEVEERRVWEEKGSKRSRIPKEQPEEQPEKKPLSVDAAVSQLGAEGLEVSRDTIYRWIREDKIQASKNKWGKIRLTQKNIEQIRQILERGQVLKQRQEKRKNLMDYLIEGKGKSPEAVRKYIQRQRKAGKTIEDIARAELEKLKNKEMGNGDIGNNMDSLFA